MDQIVLPIEIHTKFVQVYVKDKPYLVCAYPASHAEILAEVLHELGIVPKTEFGFPNATGDNYRLVGDGFCGKIGNRYRLGGKSVHYKRGPNQKHLDDLTDNIPSGIEISIDETV